jgi:pimeloyl-ACP methyl ester carboxylesterase
MDFNPVDLYYEEYGSGQPVIFLHGFPFDHTIWNPIIPLISNQARIILPDLRGFGKSPVSEGIYSMRLLAEDIYQMMNRLKIGKAILVGHSMGGYASLAFAHAYPSHLSGLVLVSTQAAADSPERRQARYKTAEAVSHKGARVVASSMLPSLTPKQELLPGIKEIILRAHPSGVVGSLKGMAERHDLTGILSDIHVPAVVLAGTNDQLLPMEKMATLAQMLPKGWLVEVQGGGHMLMMEEPQQVSSAICQVITLAETENHQ